MPLVRATLPGDAGFFDRFLASRGSKATRVFEA
jgi:hypothetical protein